MDGKSDFAVDEIQKWVILFYTLHSFFIKISILYSVGPDFMVNKFDLTTRLQIQSINVSDVYYSIHINQYEPNNIILSKLIISTFLYEKNTS